MKLVRFSVRNFRSIKKANKIEFSQTTVLVGKNNEGKSNLLKALSFAMKVIANYSFYKDFRRTNQKVFYIGSMRNNYEWNRDFPVTMRGGRGSKSTVFSLEFELNDDEVQEFKGEVKSNLNGTLRLEIRFGQDNYPNVSVSKQGRGWKAFNDKVDQVMRYIGERISFNYIPAIRTQRQTKEVIEELLSQEMQSLEKNKRYIQALETIREIQQPMLDSLSEKIKEPLLEFLPHIKNVNIKISDDSLRFRFRRDFDVEIDDGTPTSIDQKGDGVKSLVALGLLKSVTRDTGFSIVAIEEPESHLHPGATHQLQDIIQSVESDSQIVITTHNPIFINRKSIHSNIIVNQGKASQAKSISEIREILGVRVSDNLTNARFILVVEGEDDRKSMLSILSYKSKIISNAINKNLLAIESLGGAGNLPYKLTALRSAMCIFHVFFDNDDAANREIDRAMSEGILDCSQVTQSICNGSSESEFEDCLNADLYKNEVLEVFGVDLTESDFRSNQKWSQRVKQCFYGQGKKYGARVEMRIKGLIADLVTKDVGNALCAQKSGSIEGLVNSLERMITKSL